MVRLHRLALIFAAAVAAVTFAAGVPAAARADDNNGNGNAAIAINTKDGASVFRFAFAIRHIVGPVVDETNTAVAYSSCTSCSTTAIAIQILLVEGSPSTFTPTNQAIAVNYLCHLCNTFAAAYQFVVQTSGPVHFTDAGMRELQEIKRLIRALGRENLPPFELAKRLEPLIERLKHVLATQLVPGAPTDADYQDERSPPTQTVPTTDGTTTVSTQPEATATNSTGTTTGTTTTTPTTTGTTTTPTTTTP
jgi:hypothetical protein